MNLSSNPPVLQNPLVSIDITHNNLKLRIPEIKFSKLEPICELKSSIAKRVGTPPEDMKLVLKDLSDAVVAHCDDDLRCFGFYSPEDGYTLHVIDTNPLSITKQLDDLDSVQKYVMSDEDYDKLPNSCRRYIESLKINNPELFQTKNIITDPDYMKDIADTVKAGDRCEIIQDKNRGEIAYVGRLPDMAQGFYFGVKLDEPYGKNNGSYKGIVYFQCMPSYGVFLRPDKVNVGDFPEIDEFDEI